MELAPLPCHLSVDLPLRLRVQSIINEWRKGCSMPAGDCLPCAVGALLVIENALLHDASTVWTEAQRRKMIG